MHNDALAAPSSPAASPSFEVIYYEYYPRIYNYILGLVGGSWQSHLAEDLAQETFLKAFKAFYLHEHTRLLSWLYRIATNTTYDYLRRKRLIKWYSIDQSFEEREGCEDNNWILQLASGDDDPQQQYNGPGEALGAALAQLPAHYRQPLLLSEMGYEYPEIAQALNISKSALRMRIMRARNRLEQLYNEADRREEAAQA
jgi:RNA polymerase sigma-70 factor, ECF subfamily